MQSLILKFILKSVVAKYALKAVLRVIGFGVLGPVGGKSGFFSVSAWV